MAFFKIFNSVIQYFSEAVTRIFGPTDDSYPNLGVQPFDGEPLSEWIEAGS